MSLIKLVNISKTYHHQKVLDNFNYEFETGKCYLIVGANGSGKSTLVKVILGLVKPQSGLIQKDKFITNYVPEKINFPDYLTIYDFLFNLGKIRKVGNLDLKSTIDANLNKWGLLQHYSKKLHTLSKGMLQKTLIIQSLMTDASLYVFDEAINGLDEASKQLFIDEIKTLKGLDKTIIIISHWQDNFSNVVDEVIKL